MKKRLSLLLCALLLVFGVNIYMEAAFTGGGAFGAMRDYLKKVNTHIIFSADNTYDIGTEAKSVRNIHVQGTSTMGSINSNQIMVADGYSVNQTENIFYGTTGGNKIKFPDNLAVALLFAQSGNTYMHFVSTDGSEAIVLVKALTATTIGCDTVTVTANNDIALSGTGHVTSGSEGFIVGTLTIIDGSIDDSDGTITFGDTNLTNIATAKFGQDDTARGLIDLYGHTTGATQGGIAQLYTAADHDGSIGYYIIQVHEDDLLIGPNTDSDLLKLVAGTLFQVNVDMTIPSSTLTLASAGLHLLDTGADHDLIVTYNENAGQDNTLNIILGDASRSITLSGSYTFDQSVASGANVTFGTATLGATGCGRASVTGVGVSASAPTTMPGGTTAARHAYFAGNITELADATITDIVGCYVNTFTVTDGGAAETVGILASLYIPDAPTQGTVPTSGPYALFVDAGATRLDGTLASGVITQSGTTLANTYHALTTVGIVDDNLVEIDGADIASGEYARFTANGLESRTAAEVLSNIGAQPLDTDLTALATPTAWRMFYSDAADAFIQEIVLGADGTFLESNGASAAPAFRALVDGDVPTTLTLETISGTPVITNGVRIGTDTTDYLIDDATNGAASATLYIGDESILASGDIGVSIQAWDQGVRFLIPASTGVHFADGGANNCDSIVTYDTTDLEQYNQITPKAADQDLDVVYQMIVPLDFATWNTNNALDITYKVDDGTNAGATVLVYDTAGALDFTSARGQSTSEALISITAANLDGTYTDGSSIVVLVKADGDTDDNISIGKVVMNYNRE